MEGTLEMAQKVQVVLTDDIDGTEGVETASFSYNGIEYEIDLSAKNAEKFHKNMQFYADHGRRVGGRPRRSSASRSGGGKSDSASVRAWAKEAGYDVPARGRIPRSVLTAYEESQAS
jgi:nucleoid-associated protein Lsr2